MKVRRQKAKTLIDLNVTRNFINKDFARKINYKKTLKLYSLSMFDKTSLVYNNKKNKI